MSFFHDVESRIATAMQADRHRLWNLLRAVRRAEEEGRPADDKLDKLLAQVEASNQRREKRAMLVPKLVYDEALPVVARREEIAAAIQQHQIVVVSGETGSGKSTQLPKICLEIGRGVSGLIGHTQPRRIAARSIASRLAEELSTSVGQKVGFKIRFADVTGDSTLIKVMTDGVLLAESQHDRFFDQYDTLIIDEAHERSLNIDFLLGYLHRLLPKRPELKLIITSATIDALRFAEHFRSPFAGGPLAPRADGRLAERDDHIAAPVIEVSGRTYPVDVLYRPLRSEEDGEEVEFFQALADAVEEVSRVGPGDVLVFLPTERDILEASHVLRGRSLRGGQADILPLYARLSTAEQNRVFQPHSGRRIVLATNVAESSLTVPGIRYVVDSGTARISRYSARSKVQRLPIEAVSQASADQRKGRCGRIGPGVCVRLFSEDDYLARDRFTSPEIQRTNLAAVILQLLALDLGPIDEFPFLDPPRAESIRDGYKTLFELNAIDERNKLLPLGRQLARLPVDPRIGRMIVEADREHCLADVLVIAAAIETQDPRERPVDRQQDADLAHAQWADPDSDFLSYLRLWDFVQHLKSTISKSQFRKACKQNFLSEARLREWQDVHRQLLDMVQQSGLKVGKRRWTGSDRALVGTKPGPGDLQSTSRPSTPGAGLLPANEAYAAIHRALLAGLLSSVATRSDTNEYTAAGGGKFFVWPGSGVATKPKWIVGAEMVETTRRYLRGVARIDPDWIEPLAAHLVNRSYSEPHWDRRAGGAMAYEKVSLFGLTVVASRRVRYTTVDPLASRQLFIQHALVEGDFDTKADFWRQNRALLETIEARAAKTRRRELIVDPQLVFDFYDARLPRHVVDAPSLDKWRREAEKTNRRILWLSEVDVLGQANVVAQAEAFPDRLAIDRMKLPLEYRFEPGAEHDGVTLTVPKEGLAQLSEDRLGWLIPGLLEAKVEALIRALPKAVRQEFGPAPEAARKVAGGIAYASGPFLPLVAAALSKLADQPISPEMFDTQRLPPHLHMNLRVVDEKGKTLAEGRDLTAIREQLGVDAAAASAALVKDTPWHREHVSKWDFGPLPESIDIRRAGLVLTRYPALADRGDDAALLLCDWPGEAARLTRAGVRRLFILAERRELKTQVQWLPKLDKLRLFAAPLCKARPLDEQLIDLLADRAFYGPTAPTTGRIRDDVPRDAESFEARRLAARRMIAAEVQDLPKLIGPLFETYHELRLALDQPRPATMQYAVDDLREQLALLLSPGFLTATPWEWLGHYPRYLKGMLARLKKLTTAGLARDKQQFAELQPRWQAYLARAEQHRKAGLNDAELAHYRWMLEELRISLFAQELGTSLSVSSQRLDKQWGKVNA